jgi:SseB protein N-terminal domain
VALKNIPDPGFHGDEGTEDPGLADALSRYLRDPAAEHEVLAALADTRLLVPVVAVLGESEEGPDGLRRDKTSDMAVPTIRARDGRIALPAFTSVAALARWRADARPVPVHIRQAIGSAYQEKADTLLIDIAGPVTYALTGAHMLALAEGREPFDVSRDPAVARAVHDALSAHEGVLRAHLVAQPPEGTADATLGLVLAAGAAVQETAARVAAALAADEVLRARLVRGLELALLPADARLPGEPVFVR